MQELLTFLKRLDDIREFPESYINEYFTALRLEVDDAAERWLEIFPLNSNGTVLLNETRELMIKQLDISEKECLKKIDKSILSKIGLKRHKFLNDCILAQYSTEPKAKFASEDYACWKLSLIHI